MGVGCLPANLPGSGGRWLRRNPVGAGDLAVPRKSSSWKPGGRSAREVEKFSGNLQQCYRRS
jgi:hypothetical protein